MTPSTAEPDVEPMRFGVVDVETSGLDVSRHQILQIGLVVVEIDPSRHLATEIDRWSTMIRLRRPWNRVGPTHVHGLRRRDLRGAPDASSGLQELQRRLAGALFTAHNAAFDAGFLEHTAHRVGVDLDLGPQLCTLRLSRRLDPERRRSHRLGDVCERYGVSIDRPHDALEDARATASVLPALLAAHGITSLEQLTPFHERTAPAGRPPTRERRQIAS